MQARTEFDSAIEDSYRQDVQGAITVIEAASENIPLVFRQNQVPDGSRVGDHQIDAAAEHIVRWDVRRPAEIFNRGFRPQLSRDMKIDRMYNFRRYQGVPTANSVFVSTARAFHDDKGTPTIWKPDNWDKETRFRYVISGCYGGIDVNATIVEKNNHTSEHEITFVGGIRRKFIRYAVEIQNGVETKVWENGHALGAPATIPYPRDIPVERITPM
ncbi:hypothetical protein C7974DRAFT_405041 [Boeremia exigua]|uniref:uncharacterized protein n=1 Tax=Boeremia exigua TaxID=749465 RepID=UPI001E8EE45C|nr:uncharacterized protein C7974DRAFT_405041 [Boeremia exigua]KAH6613020.1 hypothetical protein C7974DRAFT_405041 [Boeremia exigua]